jgi:hypothetical protein
VGGEHAKAAGLTLSGFILETVEAHLRDKNRTPRNSPMLVDDIQKLREDNKLRHIALERAETELFRLKHNIFLQPLRGESAFNKDLVEVLQRGGTWSAHDLLQDAEFAKESLIKLVHSYENLMVGRTLSKAFGLAGLRLGYARPACRQRSLH